MTSAGICDNVSVPAARLSPVAAQQMGAKWRRTITYWREDRSSWQAAINSAQNLFSVGVSTLVCFNTEASGTDVNDVDLHTERLGEFLDLAAGSVAAIEPGNELDTPDWGISNELIIQIGRRAAAVCRARGVLCLSPSLLTGPDEGRFEVIAQGLAGYVTGMALHPYYCSVDGWPWPGWYFGTVEQKADVCQERGAGLQTWFTELGCPSKYGEIGLERQAAFAHALRSFQHPAIDVACLFALNDAMVPGGELAEGKDWGLSDAHGNAKPALAAYSVPGGQPVPDPAYVLGFKQIADRHPDIVGLPRENEGGPWLNCSVQSTTKGWLLWGNFVASGDQKGFIANDLTRYVWDGSRLRKVA